MVCKKNHQHSVGKVMVRIMDLASCFYLDVNKICRACLSETADMINMSSSAEGQDNLLEMFVAVVSFQYENGNPLPTLICKQCEEKLNVSYNFRRQCQKSNEILLEYVNRSKEPPNGVCTAETLSELCSDNDGGEDSDGSDSDLDCKRKEHNVPESSNGMQKMRLTQYSYDEVSEAIRKSSQKFFENRECIKCGFIGSNTRALSVHMMHLHKEIKERWCAQCNKEIDNLTEHMKIHAVEDLKCQFCEKIFQAKGHLTEHLRSHSEVRPFKCDVCEKSFISQRHLNVHFRIHSKEKPYKCQLCPRSFSQRISLKTHLRQHQKDFEELREEVGENQLDIQDRLEGIFKTYGSQNYCYKCDKKVRSLVVHNKQMHSDEFKVLNEYGDNVLDNKLCTVCGKQFKTASKLRLHMRVHTGEAPYKCSYCDKRVTTRNQLVVHERTHTGEKPYVCHVCGKGFAQSSVLNTHMRLHTGRPEVCNVCDQRFCRPAELRLHMRKHTGEKPYLCTKCGQAFIQRSHLVEHNKTHSDLRPFQCTYCEKSFKQNSYLKSHIQIHLGYKPFKCSQCSYACRQSYSLTQHMKQHSNDAPRSDRPHTCLLCNKTFTTHAMLTSHTNSIHNVSPPLYE